MVRLVIGGACLASKVLKSSLGVLVKPPAATCRALRAFWELLCTKVLLDLLLNTVCFTPSGLILVLAIYKASFRSLLFGDSFVCSIWLRALVNCLDTRSIITGSCFVVLSPR